jgi:uncharacterized protein YjbJ (UPF0337 family)
LFIFERPSIPTCLAFFWSSSFDQSSYDSPTGYPAHLVRNRGRQGAGWTDAGRVQAVSPIKGGSMSLIDKVTGRAKKAAGDLLGDSKVRREGAREERKGEAKEEAEEAEAEASEKRQEAADLERKT